MVDAEIALLFSFWQGVPLAFRDLPPEQPLLPIPAGGSPPSALSAAISAADNSVTDGAPQGLSGAKLQELIAFLEFVALVFPNTRTSKQLDDLVSDVRTAVEA